MDGTLNITELAGFGTGSYRLFTFDGGSLTDNGLQLGSTPSEYTYNFDINNAGGYIDLNVVPEPNAAALLMGLTASMLVTRRRRA